jgi:predicted transcriptional regulator
MALPSESELKLLRQLWLNDRMSAREVHEETYKETSWSHSSTRKTLDRMVNKGLVKVHYVHGIKTFAVVRSKLETMAILIAEFSKNVLDTEMPLPAAMFANSKMIDEDEIEQLEELLERLSKEDSPLSQ